MDAVILAAGRSGEDFQKAFGAEHKCLVEVAGRPIIQWVLDSVRNSALIDRIVVIGPEKALRGIGVTAEIIPNEAGYSESIRIGIGSTTSDQALFIAADVPLLQADNLDNYITACTRAHAEVCFPIVSWEEMQKQLPGARKTWYDLRDGKFTKGNAVVARPEALLRHLDRVESLFCTRKKKQWAGLMHNGFMGKLLGCVATQADVEKALSHYLGLHMKSIAAAPEIAVDVDEVSDVAFVEEVLRHRIMGFQRPVWAAIAA